MRFRLVTGISLLLVSLHVLAASEAQSYFDQAMNLYRDGEYSLAIDGFNSAIASGMDVPAVYYNLAVCYYRMGEYAQAEQTFKIAARFESMEALALYNLGLVSLKQQDQASAADWLLKAQQVNTDQKLEQLISAAISKIGEDDASERHDDAAAFSNWSGAVFAGLGYDDNVALDNTDLVFVSRQSAAVAELFASTTGVLSGTKQEGYLFRGSIYADMNDGFNELNIAELDGGLYLADRLGGWRNEYGLSLGRSTLGGDPYLDKATLRFSTYTRFSRAFRLDLRLRLRAIRSADTLYDPLEGASQDIRVTGKWRPEKNQDFRLYYQFDNNNRNDLQTTTRFSSFSNIRHRLRAEYKYRLTSRYAIRSGAEYRSSNYKDDNIEADGSVVRRQDQRIKLLLGLNWRLSRETLLGLKYEYVNNNSNIERFDYVSNRVLANWTLLY